MFDLPARRGGRSRRVPAPGAARAAPHRAWHRSEVERGGPATRGRRGDAHALQSGGRLRGAVPAAAGTARVGASLVKGVWAEALAAFPATARHSVQAVLRKSRCLVALRLDWLARRQGVIRDDDGGAGYLFAEYDSGGPLLVCRCGPPRGSSRWVRSAHRPPLCSTGRAPGSRLPRLDAVLAALLREVRRPPSFDSAAPKE